MNYEIVATLGPSSNQELLWKQMLDAGVTSFRLNTSHLSLEQVDIWVDRIKPFLSNLEIQPSLILDLQGSKWRLGRFPAFKLLKEQKIEIIYGLATERPATLPIPHSEFFEAAASSGGEIVLNDARSRLVIETVEEKCIKARVTQGGMISPNKGVTFSSTSFRKESFTEKDQAILQKTGQYEFIRYAISYVKDADEMARYRAIAGPSSYLIGKLERNPAITEADAIARSANELWVCRGDLGAELGLESMAQAVHQISEQVNSLPIPVIMAGQVLEHMTKQSTPTRSEVCYLYDLLKAGYAGVVLSDETAVGQNPLESCRVAALFKR